MKDLKTYLTEGQYEDELPLTPVTIYGEEHTSMIDEPVYPKDLDKLIRRINNEGDVNYICKDSRKSVEEESGLDKAEFEKSAWVAVVDPESYDNEVIIVSIDDVEFTKEDEEIYKKYRN